jgi:hypothetical protein
MRLLDGGEGRRQELHASRLVPGPSPSTSAQVVIACVTVTFSVDDQGNLHLTPVPPIDPGVAFTCFYKPWTKID